jgi:hypothetical protein
MGGIIVSPILGWKATSHCNHSNIIPSGLRSSELVACCLQLEATFWARAAAAAPGFSPFTPHPLRGFTG